VARAALLRVEVPAALCLRRDIDAVPDRLSSPVETRWPARTMPNSTDASSARLRLQRQSRPPLRWAIRNVVHGRDQPDCHRRYGWRGGAFSIVNALSRSRSRSFVPTG
jgi:hypothetical protein